MADLSFNYLSIANPFGLTPEGDSSIPTFADIDGDGDLDAFISSSVGITQFFRNTGTPNVPNFISEINNFGLVSNPTFADIDGDGDLDAFVGNSNGITQFFRNTGTTSAANFVSEADNFGLADVGLGANPTFADIDDDGDLDAFVGNSNGITQFFRNTGTASLPSFVSENSNFGLTKISGSTGPTLVDFDGDGDLDAFFSSSSDSIEMFRNIGTASVPNFVSETFGLFGVASAVNLTFADIDSDGDLDAFVSGLGGPVQLFLGNVQPTLTAFAAPVATGTEDSQITITLAQLKTQGNEADIDGTVTAFVIAGLSGGILKIGTTAATATNWGAGNQTIDATHHAYWTPPANANGLVNAFQVYVKDNSGGISLNAFPFLVQAQVNVTAVNDAPTLFSSGIVYFDTVFDDTFATANDFLFTKDIDGDALTYGIVDGVDNNNGTVSKIDPLGVLTVNKNTGAYSFVGNDAAIEALSDFTSISFTVTVSDGLLSDSATFSITIFQGDFFPSAITETNGDDILNGTAGNDRFNGLAGNDIINGLQGADILIGDLGNDVLDGGTGGDWASYSTATNAVSVNLGIVGQQDTVNAGLDTLINIENLIGSDFDDTLIGNAGANVLIGGLGDDILVGGGGTDTASYATSKAGVQVSLANTSQQNTLSAGLDIIRSIENLTGSRFNDILIGNAAANALKGGFGNDVLNGGLGDDLLVGDFGNDTLDGEDGIDSVSYAAAASGVTINLGIVGQQNTISSGLDTLSNVEGVIGGEFNDLLTGNASNNIISGGLGNDALNGGLGNDILDGGDGIDKASYNTATAGVTVNLSTVGQQDTINAGLDTLVNIEHLIGSNFDDNLTGSTSANIFIGGLGNDALDGGSGNDVVSYATANGGVVVNLEITTQQNTINAGLDTLNNIESIRGSKFNDILTGNDANNFLVGDLGNDVLDGSNGIDNASYGSAEGGVKVNLGIIIAQNTVNAGIDTLSNIENLTGSNFNDILIGIRKITCLLEDWVMTFLMVEQGTTLFLTHQLLEALESV